MYGIEIEFLYEGLRDNNRVMPELLNQGLRAVDRRNTHLGFSASEWVLKRDGSVAGGGELVSPHLDWDNPEDHAQIEKAMAALIAAGANTDKAAGIHVHVECRNFTPKQVAAVMRFTYKFEDAIYRIASSGWDAHRGLSYCNPMALAYDRYGSHDGRETRFANTLMKIRNADQLRTFYGRMDRYAAVNVHAWYRHGTMEFRVFNSTLNAKRALAYAALCVTIVDDARKGYSRSTAKHYPLGHMAAAANPETASKALFLRLQQVLRYESGMSATDWKRILWVWNDSKNQTTETISRSRYA